MEMLKNFIYAGIGLATTTSEKIKNTVEDLVEKGKISDTEGKKIVDDFFKSTTEIKEDFEDRVKKFSNELTEKFEFLKKNNSVIDDLESKIEKLEARLKEAKNKAANNVEEVAEKATKTVKKTAEKVTAKAKEVVKK